LDGGTALAADPLPPGAHFCYLFFSNVPFYVLSAETHMIDDQAPPSSHSGSPPSNKKGRRRTVPSTSPETPLSLLEELRRKAVEGKSDGKKE
jgi:hypothetical protein